MRNFWKRANRGLILGGVLVLGTSAYVGIDYFRFSHGKADMEQVLRDYTAALSQAAITPKGQAAYEYQKTDAEKEAFYQALGDVIRTYWTDTHDISTNYYCYVKSDVLMSMHDIAYDTDFPGYVTGYTTNIPKIALSKNGPGAAKFSMKVEFVIDTYGSCYFPALTSSEISFYGTIDDEEDTDTDMTENKPDQDDISESYEGHLRTTGSLTYYGELLYEDGSWKISWMDQRWDGVMYPLQTEPQEGGN